MFTGIVEEVGYVLSMTTIGDSALVRLHGPRVAADTHHGDSVAVNGVCLTVVDPPQANTPAEFTADVMAETLRRSNLGELTATSPVDLERARPVTGRLGGHLVQGHVDGTGTLHPMDAGPLGEDGEPRWQNLWITMPTELSPYVAEKGSITVDGVSLTVTAVDDDGFGVSIIPSTLRATVLGGKSSGDRVNIETDVLAKYLERLLTANPGSVETVLPAAASPATGQPAAPEDAQ